MKVVLPANNFVPRWYQLDLWQYLESGGRRAVAVWPRRHGKDLNLLHLFAAQSQKRVGTYWHILPYLNQARRIVWEGIDREGKPFLSAFPDELIERKSNVDMSLHFKNGSVFQLMGADKPDKLVGANPVGIGLSEWPLMDPNTWKLIAPILAENDGWAVFIYTPRGENHGLTILEQAKKDKRWYWSHETAQTLKVLSPAVLRSLRKELNDEALFQQEMFTSFETPISGAYYGTQMRWLRQNNRIIDLPADPRLPVNTAWDLGYDDSTTIWFYQKFHREYRVINYYEHSGEGLAHYVRKLGEIATEEGYHYGTHYFPWDVEVTDLGSGLTRLETLRTMGLKATPVRKLRVEDGIELVRNLLSLCWFDEKKCERGLNALRSYTKDYDETRQVFRNRPLHNWASHGADGFRTLATAMDSEKVDTRNLPTHAEGSYDPLNYSM